jgi:peptidoglycan hydrolase-like protein with peptidoglycan-binding domain
VAKFIFSVIATFSICMSAAAETNIQTTPFHGTQQEKLLVQQQCQTERTGLSRDQIRGVQRDLLRKGYDAGPVDGNFGPQTEQALRELQKAQHLPVTAQIGGVSRDQIWEVQRDLLRKGYNVGPVDGNFGPQTEQALREFQKDQQLPVTGQLDDRSLAALQIEQRKGSEKATRPRGKSIQSPSALQETFQRPGPPQDTPTQGRPARDKSMLSAPSSPGSQSSPLSQQTAPEEPIAREDAKGSWWRSLYERLRRGIFRILFYLTGRAAPSGLLIN